MLKPSFHATGEAMPVANLARLVPFGIPAGTDPRTWRQAVEAQVNDLLDRAMSLITALDLMEADADHEPWLGFGAINPSCSQVGWAAGDSREDDGSDWEPDDSGYGDIDALILDSETGGEPSLGWTNAMNQSSRDRLGRGNDLELDEADDEDVGDSEYSDLDAVL